MPDRKPPNLISIVTGSALVMLTIGIVSDSASSWIANQLPNVGDLLQFLRIHIRDILLVVATVVAIVLWYENYTLKDKYNRETKVRQRIHGEVEGSLGVSGQLLLDGLTHRLAGQQIVIGSRDLYNTLHLLCLAVRELLPEDFSGDITAYLKIWDRKNNVLEIVRVATSSNQLPKFKMEPHRPNASPTLPKMMESGSMYNLWSRARDGRPSSVQPSAVCGIAGLAVDREGEIPEDIAGLLCINFTEEVESRLDIHEEFLSLWLPAFSRRVLNSYLLWEQMKTVANVADSEDFRSKYQWSEEDPFPD